MSFQGVRDGLITTLVAASAFEAAIVSGSDYGILETSAGCALFVAPAGFSNEPLTYGAPRDKLVTWEVQVQGYVKDVGDPIVVLGRLWEIADEVKAAVDADDTLNGSCKKAKVSAGTQPKDSVGGPIAVDAGGATWIPFFFTVLAEEWG